MTRQALGMMALVVKDYEPAIEFYVGSLGFELIEDTPMSKDKRWVVVAPPGGTGSRLLLAKAKNDDERDAVGNQTGGRVFLFLYTDNCQRDFDLYKEAGVEFVRELSVESFGTVAVFKDLYGNLWDMVEPAKGNLSAGTLLD